MFVCCICVSLCVGVSLCLIPPQDIFVYFHFLSTNLLSSSLYPPKHLFFIHLFFLQSQKNMSDKGFSRPLLCKLYSSQSYMDVAWKSATSSLTCRDSLIVNQGGATPWSGARRALVIPLLGINVQIYIFLNLSFSFLFVLSFSFSFLFFLFFFSSVLFASLFAIFLQYSSLFFFSFFIFFLSSLRFFSFLFVTLFFSFLVTSFSSFRPCFVLLWCFLFSFHLFCFYLYFLNSSSLSLPYYSLLVYSFPFSSLPLSFRGNIRELGKMQFSF